MIAVALPMTRHYRIFGLNIASQVEFEGINEAAGAKVPDIRIDRVRVQHPDIDQQSVEAFHADADQLVLHWKAVGTFRISADNLIEIDAARGVSDRLISLPLLGSVMACLLVRRGLVVLHASAVSLDGQAVILLGHKGAGKSTTAAILTQNGFALLSDDVVALEATPGGQHVLPAFGLVKLWGETARHINSGEQRRLWQVHETIDKAHYRFNDGMSDHATPLSRVYILDRQAEGGVTTLSPEHALPAALEHAYMARYGMKGFGQRLGLHFSVLGGLAAAGAIRTLTVPRGLDRIGEVADLVRRDLKADDGPNP